MIRLKIYLFLPIFLQKVKIYLFFTYFLPIFLQKVKNYADKRLPTRIHVGHDMGTVHLAGTIPENITLLR